MEFNNASLFTAPPVYTNRVVVTFKGLTLSTTDGKKLLNGLSGTIAAGLTAVMGPTGAGKTSFLNALAGHVERGLTLEGERRINGQKYTPQGIHFGHVLQKEEFNGNLTVWETLNYAADLVLAHEPRDKRERRILYLLRELGLSHVQNVIIGTATRKGISGGQRKRVGIAMGLLTDPPLLLLDEPTAGLDSLTAMKLIQTLKHIAITRHSTIVAVIHQPQKAIYDMLDRLFLLRSGEIIYDGNAADAIAYLADVGYSYDGVSNPADHIMEVISPKMGETKAALEARCLVRQAYVTPDVDLEANIDTPLPVPEVPPSRRLQFWILFRRQALNEVREWRMHILNFLVTSLSGIMIGAVWFHIGFAQNSVARRTSCIYFAAVNQSLFSAMKAILAFPDQRAVMMRERRAKMYSCLPGFLSWSFIDMLFNIPWACLFAVITYFMVGLQNDAGKFFVWMLILCLDKMCAGSLATTICAITREASTAVVVLPVWLEMNRLFSGYFLPPNLLPTHYVWLDPLSYVKYVYVAVTLNELDGLVLPCPNVTGTNVTSTCNPHLAHATIKKFGLDFITPAGCIGALFAYIIFCRTTAYFFLRFLKH